MKQILVGIQDLLDQPNPADPAQTDGYQLFIQVFIGSYTLNFKFTVVSIVNFKEIQLFP